MSVATQVTPAQIVGEEDDEVGFVFGNGWWSQQQPNYENQCKQASEARREFHCSIRDQAVGKQSILPGQRRTGELVVFA